MESSTSLQNTLKVLMHFDLEENDPNEFSGNSFVTTCMLLMINMFANDLGIGVEYIDRIRDASTIDIFVNYDDNDMVYNQSLVSSQWPHYQNRYCFIYSNSRRVPTYEMITKNLFQLIYFSVLPFVISWVYHYLILHFRVHKTNFESVSRAFIYSLQKHVSSSIPTLDKYPHERFFLCTMFLYVFIITNTYTTFFATQFTVPTIRPATDREMFGNQMMEPIKDFGIGEPCLFELTQGLYLRRGCLMACDVANATVRMNHGIVFLKEEIIFQHIFKVSKTSIHYGTITKLVRRYFEAGMLDRIFADIHRESHKFLESRHFHHGINLVELHGLLLNLVIIGLTLSTLAFVMEHVVFNYIKWSQRPNYPYLP